MEWEIQYKEQDTVMQFDGKILKLGHILLLLLSLNRLLTVSKRELTQLHISA